MKKKLFFIISGLLLIGGSLFAYIQDYDEIPIACPMCSSYYLTAGLVEKADGGYTAICFECGHQEEITLCPHEAGNIVGEDEETAVE